MSRPGRVEQVARDHRVDLEAPQRDRRGGPARSRRTSGRARPSGWRGPRAAAQRPSATPSDPGRAVLPRRHRRTVRRRMVRSRRARSRPCASMSKRPPLRFPHAWPSGCPASRESANLPAFRSARGERRPAHRVSRRRSYCLPTVSAVGAYSMTSERKPRREKSSKHLSRVAPRYWTDSGSNVTGTSVLIRASSRL